jgi:3-dehydroquinate synthase
MEKIRVNLEKPYSIHITREDSLWPLEEIVGAGPAIILTTSRVARYALPFLKKKLGKLPVLTLPDGEKYKNLATVAKAYRGLVRLKADRATRLILLGGGVLGDLGGFVAATYLRGIPFVQIPTTLVGQVDSSIGGKVGVDLIEGKNLVGAFRQPEAVLAHIPFLKTLPLRDIIGGLGEVLKYGVIEDPSLFQLVRTEKEKIIKRDPSTLFEIVRRSAAIKARVVSLDEKESGLRMILNFGHTFGHAIERLTRYRKFHHGEAVGIGMVIAARISHQLGFCSKEEAETVREGVLATGLPVEIPLFPRSAWLSAIEVDKKTRGGMIHFVLMKKIGEVVTEPIAPKELVKFL